MRDPGPPGGDYREGRGINAPGHATGGSNTVAGGPLHAFLWDPATGMQDIHPFGRGESLGSDINANGQVTGYSTGVGERIPMRSCGTRRPACGTSAPSVDPPAPATASMPA